MLNPSRRLCRRNLTPSQRLLHRCRKHLQSPRDAQLGAVSKAKVSFKEGIKVLNKTINNLTRKVEDQLTHKNAHNLEMKKMKNDYQKMGLDELCEKITNKKACGVGGNGPMSLEFKKAFVTHQAYVKQVSKDANPVCALQQKEIKKKGFQSNLRFAANMLHNTSILNDGMWSSTSVGDVSC